LWELKQQRGWTWNDFLLKGQPEFEALKAAQVREQFVAFLKQLSRKAGPKYEKEILNSAAAIEAGEEVGCLRGNVFFTKKNGWEFLKTKTGKILEPHEKEMLLNYIYEIQRQQLNQQALRIYSLFEVYLECTQAWKQREHRIDFTDLSMGAYQLFYNEESFGARYYLFQGISHLLVDEFQDSSNLQWDIYRAIAEELLSGQGLAAEKGILPTVFFVGDAKQSIYGFRQANYQLLSEAAGQLKEQFDVETIHLNQSWRSSQFFLDQINELFLAPEYQGELQDFTAHTTAEIERQPVVPRYGSFTLLEPVGQNFGNTEAKRQEEARQVVEIIEHWLNQPLPVYDKGTGRYRALTYRDIGILYREKIQSVQLEQALIQKGLPYRMEEKKGYYDRREIQDVLCFLKFLAQPTDDVALAGLLRSPLLGLSDADFMSLLEKLQRAQLQAATPTPGLFELLETHHPECFRLLSHSLAQVGKWSLDRIVLQFLERTRAFAAYRLAWGDDEGQLVEANLKQLVQIMALKRPPGAGTILDYLDLIKQELTADETGNAPLTSNCITLMTIHKAKGLEFPVVFLIGAEKPLVKLDHKKDYGFRKSITGEQPFVYVGKTQKELPPNIHGYRDLMEDLRREARKESMRLLYVALTRAREHLVVTSLESSGAELFYQVIKNGIFKGEEPEELFPGIFGYRRQALPPDQLPKSAAEQEEVPLPEKPDFSPIAESGVRLVRPSTLLTDALFQQPAEGVNEGLDEAPAPEVSLREREKAKIIGTVVHRGIEAHLCNRAWQLEYALETESMNSFLRFEGDELVAMQQIIESHLSQTLDSPALQQLLQQATGSIQTELPVVHLQGKSLVYGIIDLLVPCTGGYWVIDFKTIPVSGRDRQAVIAEHHYERQLRHYARAVVELWHPDTVRTAVFFTQVGELHEVKFSRSGD
ncbi:MAG: hypothetical protein D6814_14835, partial [Calditrichaeota bacterium]